MTLLVAIKVPPSKPLLRRPRISFTEPGFVIAADTRFSFLDGSRPPDDKARKIHLVSDGVLAGYAGDVEIVESALFSAWGMSDLLGTGRDLKFWRAAVPEYLRYWTSEVEKKRKHEPSLVFLCLQKPPRLVEWWVMKSENNFKGRRHSGIYIAGSGEVKAEPIFDDELGHTVQEIREHGKSDLKLEIGPDNSVRLAQRDKNEIIKVDPRKLCDVVAQTVKRTIKDAGLETVGGYTSCYYVTGNEITSIYLTQIMKDGKVRNLSTNDLEDWTIKVKKEYLEAPALDRSGKIENGRFITLKFKR